MVCQSNLFLREHVTQKRLSGDTKSSNLSFMESLLFLISGHINIALQETIIGKWSNCIDDLHLINPIQDSRPFLSISVSYSELMIASNSLPNFADDSEWFSTEQLWKIMEAFLVIIPPTF